LADVIFRQDGGKMADIYRQELAIPEKRRVFGWIMLAGGILMVLIAIYLYFTEVSQIQKYQVRPWETNTQNTLTPQQESDLAVKKAMIDKARPLTWIVLIAILLLIVFVVIAAINHRLAYRWQTTNGRAKNDTNFVGDPWKEAGERFQMNEDDSK
jgi:uncharacterized integral membrane protein